MNLDVIKEHLKTHRGDVAAHVKACMSRIDESVDREKLKRDIKHALIYARIGDLERAVMQELSLII